MSSWALEETADPDLPFDTFVLTYNGRNVAEGHGLNISQARYNLAVDIVRQFGLSLYSPWSNGKYDTSTLPYTVRQALRLLVRLRENELRDIRQCFDLGEE